MLRDGKKKLLVWKIRHPGVQCLPTVIIFSWLESSTWQGGTGSSKGLSCAVAAAAGSGLRQPPGSS